MKNVSISKMEIAFLDIREVSLINPLIELLFFMLDKLKIDLIENLKTIDNVKAYLILYGVKFLFQNLGLIPRSLLRILKD